MLTCIARSKQPINESSKHHGESGNKNHQSIKHLTSQIKDMALKASGAYKTCNPCTQSSGARVQHRDFAAGSGSSAEWTSERFRWSYRRAGSANSAATARLKGLSSGEGTPSSGSSRRVDPIVFVEESEPKEWVAQVEPGVLITFVSMPRGGNELRRIRFSRETFNKLQAQRWWAENYDKVMELYNVQKNNHHAFPPATPARSEDENSKNELTEDSPVTPPLTKERLPRNLHRPLGMGVGSSSSDSLEHHPLQPRNNCHDSGGFSSTPKLSSISGTKTETSSVDASMRTSSSRDADQSGEPSISNASDPDAEWVEQDEAGVYITIRALPNGQRELRRVRFSREKFGEMHARLWWEENRARIHEQYL